MNILSKWFKRSDPYINWRKLNIDINSIETLFQVHTHLFKDAKDLNRARIILNRVQVVIYAEKIRRKY